MLGKPGLGVSVVANWGPRREDPEALADRWIRMLGALRTLHPDLHDWYDGLRRGRPPLSPTRKHDISAGIAENVCTNDDGSPYRALGYLWCATNSNAQKYGSRDLSLNMSAGSYSLYTSNNVNMRTEYGIVPDPSIVTYPVLSGATLALAEAFDATRAFAYPKRMLDFQVKPSSWHPTLPLAWISYIAPRFAHLVMPPPSAIVEHRADGGLLMAATDEPFDVDIPRHMAVAREIEAAVAPFNALPWPPESHIA